MGCVVRTGGVRSVGTPKGRYTDIYSGPQAIL